jgi:hypothetical protein
MWKIPLTAHRWAKCLISREVATPHCSTNHSPHRRDFRGRRQITPYWRFPPGRPGLWISRTVPPQTLRPFCLRPPKSLFLGNRDRLDQRLLPVAMLLRNGGPGGTKQHVSEQVFSRRRNAQAGNSRTLISRVAVTSAYEAGITATRVCELSMLS